MSVSVEFFSEVLVVSFKSESDLSRALLRPHIAYEKAELRGPLKGVNFPIMHLVNWALDEQENLRPEEKHILSLLKFKNNKHFSFEAIFEKNLCSKYLCAFIDGDVSTFAHEWAHATFYLNEDYRNIAKKEWSKLSTELQTAIEKELAFRNYHESVFIDEFQAYIVEGAAEFGKKHHTHLINSHKILKKALGDLPNLKSSS